MTHNHLTEARMGVIPQCLNAAAITPAENDGLEQLLQHKLNLKLQSLMPTVPMAECNESVPQP